MCDLAWLPRLFAMVTNENLGAGSQSTFHAIGIEQTRYDPAEYVPAVH